MESALRSALLLGVFVAPCSHAQGISGTTAGSNILQPWLVGLTAVMCFLFVIFAASLVNRFFCSKKKDAEEKPESGAQQRTGPNAYDNIALEAEEGSSKAVGLKVEDDKQTNL